MSRSVLEILSVVPITGLLGIDRLYLGQPWHALFKAVTIGGLGVWYALDAFIGLAEGAMGRATTILNPRLHFSPQSIKHGRATAFAFLILFVCAQLWRRM